MGNTRPKPKFGITRAKWYQNFQKIIPKQYQILLFHTIFWYSAFFAKIRIPKYGIVEALEYFFECHVNTKLWYHTIICPSDVIIQKISIPNRYKNMVSIPRWGILLTVRWYLPVLGNSKLFCNLYKWIILWSRIRVPFFNISWRWGGTTFSIFDFG